MKYAEINLDTLEIVDVYNNAHLTNELSEKLVEIPSNLNYQCIEAYRNAEGRIALRHISNVKIMNEISKSNMEELRRKRNALLAETDKYVATDFPHKSSEDVQVWLDYRQALRDLPNNTRNVDANGAKWPKLGECPSIPRTKIFTGQQTCSVSDDTAEEGMVVCANQNKYGDKGTQCSNAITINESTPNVSLCSTAMDKSCFGVISQTFGHKRAYINSVGEGAMWVTDINGSLESGDYITTSNVAGYGQRQDDDVLHNYTVAKITMDCDFNPPDIPVQRILKELANVTYWYQLEDATSNAYDRTQEETYWTVNRYTEVPGRVDEQSNVFVSPDHDLELYTKTRVNVITAEVWEALPEGERAYYSETDANTFAYTQTIQISPETWDDLSPEEQNTYVHGYYDLVVDEVPPETSGATQRTRTVYKNEVNETTEEPENPEDYLTEVRQEWVNVLDEHGQLQWEDVPWGATEKAYNIRYLDANGGLTTRHNAVHTAAFVGVTYHCG
jgi:hypothetical protein